MSWEELTLPFDEHVPESAVAGTVAIAAAVTDGCDLSTQCGHCGGAMRPEHAHYRCTQCGQRDSCCDGPY